ncbi:MAG: hypothetical protein ACI8V8_002524, partial [Chitinophagales bacterium]
FLNSFCLPKSQTYAIYFGSNVPVSYLSLKN